MKNKIIDLFLSDKMEDTLEDENNTDLIIHLFKISFISNTISKL